MTTQYIMQATHINSVPLGIVHWVVTDAPDLTGAQSGYNIADLINISVDYTSTVVSQANTSFILPQTYDRRAWVDQTTSSTTSLVGARSGGYSERATIAASAGDGYYASHSVSSNPQVGIICATVTAFNTISPAQNATWMMRARYYRSGGTVTLGTMVYIMNEDPTSYYTAPDFNVSSTNIRVRVPNQANTGSWHILINFEDTTQ